MLLLNADRNSRGLMINRSSWHTTDLHSIWTRSVDVCKGMFSVKYEDDYHCLGRHLDQMNPTAPRRRSDAENLLDTVPARRREKNCRKRKSAANRRETVSPGVCMVSILKVEHEDILVINPSRDTVQRCACSVGSESGT